jgi:predicted nuclease of predicted toxin-antitoxin system
MHLVIDNNVPESVAEKFRARGHRVELVREILAANAHDQLIAAYADLEGAVLVTGDRDFRQIAKRIPPGGKTRFKRLSRISIECHEPRAAQRIEEEIEFIELEYAQAQQKADKRIFIVVQDRGIKIHR